MVERGIFRGVERTWKLGIFSTHIFPLANKMAILRFFMKEAFFCVVVLIIMVALNNSNTLMSKLYCFTSVLVIPGLSLCLSCLYFVVSS